MRYVQSVHGGRYHYFRRPGFPPIRLSGIIGSPEFMKAYEALLDEPISRLGPTIPGAIANKKTYKKPSYVYLFRRADGAIKVGVTRNVRRRLVQLNTASPDILQLLKVTTRLKDARCIERACKKLLRPRRIKGEWFRCSDELAIEVLQITKRIEELKVLIGH